MMIIINKRDEMKEQKMLESYPNPVAFRRKIEL